MKKNEMEQVFRQELVNQQERLRRCLAENRDGRAQEIAAEITGAAGLARRLGIIDRDQKQFISEQVWAAARREAQDEPA